MGVALLLILSAFLVWRGFWGMYCSQGPRVWKYDRYHYPHKKPENKLWALMLIIGVISFFISIPLWMVYR